MWHILVFPVSIFSLDVTDGNKNKKYYRPKARINIRLFNVNIINALVLQRAMLNPQYASAGPVFGLRSPFLNHRTDLRHNFSEFLSTIQSSQLVDFPLRELECKKLS
jgi:hypothetical protein